MSKPEEIDQDVWSSAESALDDMLCNCIEASGTAEQFRIDSIVPIARILMAERERFLAILPQFVDQITAEDIAAAIRKGGAA